MTKAKKIRVMRTMKDKRKVIAFVVVFALVGVVALVISRAATPSASFEAENATTIAGCVTKVSDATASGSASIKFGSSTGCGAGANLPITYVPETLTGTIPEITGKKRFVSCIDTPGDVCIGPNGSNSAASAGPETAPYETLAYAITRSGKGDMIVVRGGTYRQGNIDLITASYDKSVKIIAYTGETPEFNGAQAILPSTDDSSGWEIEGGLRYRTYTPMDSRDASGFSNSNLAGDGVGKLADQAWVGDQPLKQKILKDGLANGQFFVEPNDFTDPLKPKIDHTKPTRLYMTSVDAAEANIQISNKNHFLAVHDTKVTIEGIRVMRYSNNAATGGVIRFHEKADGSTMRNVEISGSAYSTVSYIGSRGAGLHENAKMQNVTITESNWMGVVAIYTNNLILDAVKISKMNPNGEFKNSPQSGALKTSRTWDTKVINSEISNNGSHGIWFDESNYRIVVANNQITNNNGSGVFFEISDDLLLINNYIRSPASGYPVVLSSSSGLKIVNNTIIGGLSPLAIYAEGRSGGNECWNPARPGGLPVDGSICFEDGTDCWNPARPRGVCKEAYALTGNWDVLRREQPNYPATMQWKPALDLMINNIIAYPDGSRYTACVKAPFCISPTFYGGFYNPDPNVWKLGIKTLVNIPIKDIIHKEYTRGTITRRQTVINGNVYATTGVSDDIISIGAGMLKKKDGTTGVPTQTTPSIPMANYTNLIDVINGSVTVVGFINAMARDASIIPYVNITGLESAGKVGNDLVENTDADGKKRGNPTQKLIDMHSQAVPIDASVTAFDSNIICYISAGTKHYGYNVTNPKPTPKPPCV